VRAERDGEGWRLHGTAFAVPLFAAFIACAAVSPAG